MHPHRCTAAPSPVLPRPDSQLRLPNSERPAACGVNANAPAKSLVGAKRVRCAIGYGRRRCGVPPAHLHARVCPCQREAGGGAAGATAAEHVHTFLLFHVSLS